jgi:ComF family protein
LRDESLWSYQCCYQCGIALQVSEIAEQRCTQCQTLKPYFDETYCLDRYDGLLQTPLHELKYQKPIAFANTLGRTWSLLLGEGLEGIAADYLLPVPLSVQRLAQRGFNQSWEIAKRIQCSRHIQKSPYVLQRHHYAGQQAGSTLSHRHLAIQGMFYIKEHYIQHLAHKTVIVFDDVMTSGATLNEIARVLKDNGASRVIN